MRRMLLFLSMILGFISAQQLELKTPHGSLRITLRDETQYLRDKGEMSSDVLIDYIASRLDKIEEVYMIKLRKSDRRAVASILDEIRFLVGLFPKDYYVIVAPYLPEPETPPILPMSDPDFAILLSRLNDESFADEKLNILRTAAGSNFFLVEQVEKILSSFSFEEDRLNAVRILYPQVLDLENAFRLYSKFEFSDSKEKLEKILQ